MRKQNPDNIVQFLKCKLSQSNLSKFVLGLSGGIDSTLTLALAVKAVGSENVLTYSLPSEVNGKSTERARKIAEYFGVSFEIYNISLITNAYKERAYGLMPEDYYRLGNIMARTRMTILYDKALLNKALVLNTCNLSEDLVGYATKYGDAAGDIAPIAHLTKTEVYAMAEDLGIPEELIDRTPSAELWKGQTDESEMGFTYKELDKVIDYYMLHGIHRNEFPRMYEWMKEYEAYYNPFISFEAWENIKTRNKNAQHKLNPMPSLSNEGWE